MCRNGSVVLDSDSEDDNKEDDLNTGNNSCSSTAAGSVSTLSDNELLQDSPESSSAKKSASTACGIDESKDRLFHTLSKSLGARDFHFQIDNEVPPPIDETFCDANDKSLDEKTNPPLPKTTVIGGNPELSSEKFTDKIYISSAFSIEYSQVPDNPKYTR